MQIVVPVKINSQVAINELGFTLVFDKNKLSYNASQQDVRFNSSLNTSNAFVAFGDGITSLGGGYIAPYIKNIALAPGSYDLCTVLLDIVQGATGITGVSIDGHIQPFTAIGPNGEQTNVDANVGIVNLTAGTVTPIVIDVTPSNGQAVANNISNIISAPIPTPTPTPSNVIDHITGAISTIGNQISNTVSNLTGGNTNVNTPSLIPQSVSGLFSNPTALLIGAGLLIYLLKKK